MHTVHIRSLEKVDQVSHTRPNQLAWMRKKRTYFQSTRIVHQFLSLVLWGISFVMWNRSQHFLLKKSEFNKATWAQWFKIDNFTLLKNTDTIFIGILEKNRNSDKRVLKPLNLILILFLFPDFPIEGLLKKIYKNRRGHKAEELVKNPCILKRSLLLVCWSQTYFNCSQTSVLENRHFLKCFPSFLGYIFKRNSMWNSTWH